MPCIKLHKNSQKGVWHDVANDIVVVEVPEEGDKHFGRCFKKNGVVVENCVSTLVVANGTTRKWGLI